MVLQNLIFHSNILLDIGIIIVFATILSYLVKSIKQPLIPAYIISGIIIGPVILGLISNMEEIKILAELGIAFLLFMVGLEIDISKIKYVGYSSVIVGLIAFVLVSILGFAAGIIFNFLTIEAAYLGIILAFSSTMVVIKLLSDVNEIGTLHGRLILGILLLQDVIAILALSILSSQEVSVAFLILSVIKGLGLFLLTFLISKFVLPYIFKYAAKSQELLFLTSVAAFFFFALFAYSIGFSIVIGAFIAGLGLASLPYNFDIVGQVRPLRDFFATLFFVSLGMQMAFSNLSNIILPLIVLIIIAMIIKPFIIMTSTSLLGYGKRTSFFTGLNLAQISEFSLIIVAQGLILGHISENFFSIIVLTAVITMALTPYFVRDSNKMYKVIGSKLTFLNNRKKIEELGLRRENDYDIILFGCHRLGSVLLKNLLKTKKKVLVVDYDPSVIKDLIRERIDCLYGDLINEEILKKINFKKAKIVILTVPDKEDSLFLLNHVKNINKEITTILTSSYIDEAIELYNKNADYVIVPRIMAAECFIPIMKDIFNNKINIKNLRDNNIHELLSVRVYGD
jgi:Kef-type K+ transport system membrane component KefB